MNPNTFKINPANPIILDISNCKYADEIHLRIKDTFGFPEYYGMNWDAMWDCIRYYFKKTETRSIQVKGIQTLSQDLIEYCNPMWDVFYDLKKTRPGINFSVVE